MAGRGGPPRRARWPAGCRRGGGRSRDERRVGRAPRNRAAPAARSRNRATAGLARRVAGSVSSSAGTGSGSTQATRSRGTPIAIRLVATIVSPGVRVQSSASAGAAPRTCSTVSRTSRLGARPSVSARDSASGRPGSWTTSSAPAIAGSTSEASLTPSSATKATRPSQGREGDARQLDREPALAHAADPRERDEGPLATKGLAAECREVQFAPHERAVGPLGDGAGPARIDGVRHRGGPGRARRRHGKASIALHGPR